MSLKSINKHIIQAELRIKISKLETAIHSAINAVSTEEKNQITYAEINAALIRVLNSLNAEELRDLIEKGDKA